MAESFWTGISSILTLITLLTSCLLVLPVYYSLKEKKIKFRVLTSSKRTQERIFDAGALLLFIGILLGRNPGAEDLRCFGALFLAWSTMSWVFQRRRIQDTVQVHLIALGLLILIVCLIMIFMVR
ncbi:MAG: hypothetical protein OXI24_17450 [Candidatus Poribacteria bacterium]|nr:hypothetical protein [Candidatus Poribacteria bacterium]MDE0556007.1 hypothetical protein [Candidatus Poribacteria bacterium]